MPMGTQIHLCKCPNAGRLFSLTGWNGIPLILATPNHSFALCCWLSKTWMVSGLLKIGGMHSFA
jgi:hypothetical protein